MSEDAPFTRAEVLALGDQPPRRGPICPRCGIHVPQFTDLTDHDHGVLMEFLRAGDGIAALQYLRSATGCSLLWAKAWVHHGGQAEHPLHTAPCPYCGQSLRTASARQCRHCGRDWHE